MIIVKILLIMLASYLFGSIPFGFLIGKMKGIDIRKVGSCNIGATNVTRSVGKWYGKLCFFLDLFKGFLPVFVAKYLFKDDGAYLEFMPLVAGACSITGHMFSVYLKFTGGKGVATGSGIILGLAPITFAAVMISWIVIFLVSRYVSLASIIVSGLLIVYAIIFRLTNIEYISLYSIIFFAMIGGASIYKHRSNITRLLNGTELKFAKK